MAGRGRSFSFQGSEVALNSKFCQIKPELGSKQATFIRVLSVYMKCLSTDSS